MRNRTEKKDTFTSKGGQPLVIGVDVGGTKIAAGVVDAQGKMLGRSHLPTDTSSPERTLHSIAAAITEAMAVSVVKPEQVDGVGLGIPGKVDAQRGLGLLSANLGWRDVPVRDWLERQFAFPCFLENDVGVATLGESIYGAGQGVKNLLYLSLGTGIAVGVVITGSLYRGTNGLAGEIGHTVFVPDGPSCSCGGHGCLEALAAGPALARQAQEAIESGRVSLLQDRLANENGLTTERVFEAARQGDALALEILQRAAKHLAYAIYLLSMIFDPQIIVLGGGLALEDGPLVSAIQAEVVRWSERSPIFREILLPDTIRLTSLKRDAGILGAAALVTRGKRSQEGVFHSHE